MNATWTAREAPLATTLTARLGTGVQIERFQWSGKNSYREREIAGARLADFLKALVKRHPDSKLFIIAHSHGGNVARYALENDNLASQIQGLVTLATPFLEAEERNIYGIVTVATHGLLFLLCIYLINTYGVPLTYRGLDFANTLDGWKYYATWLAVVYGGYVFGNLVAGVYSEVTRFLPEDVAVRLAERQEHC
jgi:pimeloyl-ACP methyl ester carboxylesterase